MFDRMVGYIYDIKSVFKQTAIYFAVVHTHGLGHEMAFPVGFRIVDLCHFSGCWIQNVDTVIFRPNPDVAVWVFRQFADAAGIQRIFRTGRDEPFKQ